MKKQKQNIYIQIKFFLQLNRKEFDDMDEETRAQFEGYRPGVYVRVQINNMPCEFVENFDCTYPVILGALLASEHNIGYVQVIGYFCEICTFKTLDIILCIISRSCIFTMRD